MSPLKLNLTLFKLNVCIHAVLTVELINTSTAAAAFC